MSQSFPNAFGDELDIEYAGNGHRMAKNFYIPVLKNTSKYDRASGYFSVGSLVVVSAGMAHLIHNEGSVRLIVGLHDVGKDLEDVYSLSQTKAAELLDDVGEKIAQGLENIEDVFSRQRLEALAWMLVENRLEIKVAIPKRTYMLKGNGIFHQKRLLFYDSEENVISAIGSSNETQMAWTQNGENLSVFASWRPGIEQYITRQKDEFEALWTNDNPDFLIFSLPEAVNNKLRQRYYPERKPEKDPVYEIKEPDTEKMSKLVPVARLINQLGNLRGFEHLGLGPVRLYPHQVSVMNFALERFPHRVLIADEVGLGKTIEVGSIIKRLIEQGTAERVLILAPKNVTRQWQDEMWYLFNQKFWRLETGPKTLFSPEDEQIPVGDRNPFDIPAINMMIASWHYTRGTRRRPSELLSAEKYFDLVIVDEAHAARQLRNNRGEITPTLLNQLCMELSITSPHLILVTATPVQLDELEAWDLLRILGLGGPWAHEDSFERYYDLLRNQDTEEKSEWIFAFNLASWVAQNYLTSYEREELIQRIFSDSNDAMNFAREIQYNGDGRDLIEKILVRKPEDLISLLIALSPIHWFMVRNNRNRLKEMGYTFPERILKEVPVHLEPRHIKILDDLDTYLGKYYGLYEQLLSKSNRGVFGFVRTIYHQRFVSSFTASYLTIKSRREFLEAIIREDHETLLRVANRILDEADWDGDEYEIVETALNLLKKAGGRQAVEQELEIVRALEYQLSTYAPDRISIDDPKLSSIHNQICEIINEGRQVLVFSKYTDTVDAIIEYIEKMGAIQLSRIGSYTGAGGRLFGDTRKSYDRVSKIQVKKALEDNIISVLICSEAASEGLNLQSASAVINVDMPWNPSKVEQRIGRVDRLGQKQSTVLVRNVWYPDSIEAEMYRRLFDRGETYRLVVGPAQEIISKTLSKAFDEGLKGESLRDLVDETIRTIEEVRHDPYGVFQGHQWTGDQMPGDHLIQCLTQFIEKAGDALGLETSTSDSLFTIKSESKLPSQIREWNNASLVPGNPNTLTPAHPIVKWIIYQITSQDTTGQTSDRSLYVINDHRGLGTLVEIPFENGASLIVKQEHEIAELITSLMED